MHHDPPWAYFVRRCDGLVAAAVGVAGCGSSPPNQPAAAPTATGATDTGPIAVVASTNVYGSIVTAVGGDRVKVTSIINSPDADPHGYEATPADAAAVSQAKLVVVNGGGYDDFASKLIDAAPTAPAVLNAVDLSGLDTAASAATSAAGASAGEFNEHVWYSLPSMKKLADQIAAELAAADPAASAAFRQNAAAFDARLDELIRNVAAIKAGHAGDKVAITEPVPLYLVQDTGLINATRAQFSDAVEEGNDPPAAVLNDTLALFTSKQVKALLANTQTENPSTRQIEQAAKAAGIPRPPSPKPSQPESATTPPGSTARSPPWPLR